MIAIDKDDRLLYKKITDLERRNSSLVDSFLASVAIGAGPLTSARRISRSAMPHGHG
jgi:hypothetical protein